MSKAQKSRGVVPGGIHATRNFELHPYKFGSKTVCQTGYSRGARAFAIVLNMLTPAKTAVPRLVVGITGGSGIPYALDLLETLSQMDLHPHLIVSSGAVRVHTTEGRGSVEDLERHAFKVYDEMDIGASIASGSFRTLGMVIVPCSSSTLAKVAHGLGDDLISRAAHVTLKERRPLILVPREAPYPRPMLENMLKAFDAGASILPASPGFYHAPDNVKDLLGFLSARVLDQFGIESGKMRRWEGDS